MLSRGHNERKLVKYLFLVSLHTSCNNAMEKMAVCFQPFVPELFGLHIGCALALNFVRRKHNVIVHGHKGIPEFKKNV